MGKDQGTARDHWRWIILVLAVEMSTLDKQIKYPPEIYRDEYDMTYVAAKAYQEQAVKALKEIFGEELVKSEWDSLTYDGHAHNHKLVYGPRTDIVIGPFNSYADLDTGNDRTAMMKKHMLVRRLQERTGDAVIWNNFARCFLAIEIVFSGSSKHITGDFLNATSTGAIGFVVAHKNIYQKVKRTLNYFHRLQEFGRLHENGLQNIMLFSDEEFLEFLWELKNPEKVIRLDVKKSFNISFRNGFLKKEFPIYSYTTSYKPQLIPEEVTRLSIYGFDVRGVTEEHDVALTATKYTSPSSAYIFDIDTLDQKHVRVMDLMDIVVRPQYRNKGIGTQILKIFEQIARDNKCQYICGELGYDRSGEPIELQKNFFTKNGYTVWFDKRAQFSKLVVKKVL